MATYRVRVEYALAFDLDIEVEAPDENEAFGLAQLVVDQANLLERVRGEFREFQPSITNGEVLVTDLRVAPIERVEAI